MSVENDVEAFLLDCRARGLSLKTLRDSYGSALRTVLLPFCQRQGIKDTAELDKHMLNRLSTELLERKTPKPLSPYTVQSYLRPINAMLQWAHREGLNEGARAHLPRTRKKQLDPLSREEMDRLEEAAVSERDRLIIRLLANTGMREGELASITVQDLSVRGRDCYVRVRGKTGERLVPVIPQTLARRLIAYRERTRAPRPGVPNLFVSERRLAGRDYAGLGESGIYKVVKDAAWRASLGKRVYPHLLRHSAITWMVSRGLNPIAISDITGCGIEMIAQVYSHLGHADHHRMLLKLVENEDQQ